VQVALFSQWAPPEPTNVVGPLAAELTRLGHKVDYVTGYPNYPDGRVYDGYSIRWRTVQADGQLRTVRVPLYPSHDRSGIRRTATYLSYAASAATIGLASIRRPDVAYVYHPPLTSAWPARVQRRFRGTPFVFHVQDLWPDSVVSSGMAGPGTFSRIVERALHRMCIATYRASASIITISPGMKDIIASRGIERDKIHVITNWADEGLYGPRSPSVEARNVIGPPGSRIVLYAGNLGFYQGLEAAVRAAAIAGRRTNLHLTIMGEGIARERLASLVKSMDIRNVWLVGARRQAEMPAFLAAADAHLVSLVDLPFFSATIPGKTQVALASAKPIVAAVRGDAARLVAVANAGICCEPNEPGLIDAFRRLGALTESELAVMGHNGRQYYVEHLSMGKGVAAVQRLLESAARGRAS
jgi:colanic acid biosynthesis glycosyl transferase WcaI